MLRLFIYLFNSKSDIFLSTQSSCGGLFLHLIILNDIQTPIYTLGRTPPVEGSSRRRDLYLTKQNTQKREVSTSLPEIEPAIPVSQRLQTHALDCAATGISSVIIPTCTYTGYNFIFL